MRFLKKIRQFFRRQRLDVEMADEMREHLERRMQANLDAGMPVNTLLFNPVPGPNADRLVQIGELGYMGRETAPTRGGISGAGLMIQSVVRLLRVDPGFDPENRIVVTGSAPNRLMRSGAPTGPRYQFYDQIRERFAAVPGVTAVGIWKNGVRVLAASDASGAGRSDGGGKK